MSLAITKKAMNSYIKKALVSASISSAGLLISSLGAWVLSGNLDTKILLGAVVASVGSWLVAIGRILTQWQEDLKNGQEK